MSAPIDTQTPQESSKQSYVLGPYRLLESLGEGGMARVFKAELQGESGFSKTVALKIVHPHLALAPEFKEHFIGEARLGGYLSHRHIVETLNFGEADGHLYLALEFVDGPTLSEVLEAHGHYGRTIPLEIALEIMIQACSGLRFAHEARDNKGNALNIVHRDLKPANLILSPEKQVKLGDFGVARASSNLIHTQHSGVLKGTPRYMSPEQAWGSRDIDFRSDIFSAGLILFELLTHRPLYCAETRERIVRRAQDAKVGPELDAIPQSPVRNELGNLLGRMLTVEPGNRLAPTATVLKELSQIAQQLGARPELSPWIEEVQKDCQALRQEVSASRTGSGASSIPPTVASLKFDHSSCPTVTPTPDPRPNLPSSVPLPPAPTATLRTRRDSVHSTGKDERTRVVSPPLPPLTPSGEITEAPKRRYLLVSIILVPALVLSILMIYKAIFPGPQEPPAGNMASKSHDLPSDAAVNTDEGPAFSTNRSSKPATNEGEGARSEAVPMNESATDRGSTAGPQPPVETLKGSSTVHRVPTTSAAGETNRSGNAAASTSGSNERARKNQPDPNHAKSDSVAVDRASSDRASSDRASSDRASSDRASSDRASSDRASSDRASSDRASSDRASSDRASSDRASSEAESSASQTSIAQGEAGTLTLNSRPQSTIVIDGSPSSAFPVTALHVPSGPHTILFRGEKGVELEQSLTLEPGVHQRCTAFFARGKVICRKD